ncbi:MAG: spore cortex biosynthesis protein YabQ [Eubacteriales bacterium]
MLRFWGQLLYALLFGGGCWLLYALLRSFRVSAGLEQDGQMSAVREAIARRLPFLKKRDSKKTPNGKGMTGTAAAECTAARRGAGRVCKRERRCVRRGAGAQCVVVLTDILYFLFVGLSTSVFAYATNQGQLRWFALLGMLGGVLFLRYVLAVPVLYLLLGAQLLLSTCLQTLWRWVMWPLSFALRQLVRMVGWAWRKIDLLNRKIYGSIYTRHHSRRQMREILAQAAKGT